MREMTVSSSLGPFSTEMSERIPVIAGWIVVFLVVQAVTHDLGATAGTFVGGGILYLIFKLTTFVVAKIIPSSSRR